MPSALEAIFSFNSVFIGRWLSNKYTQRDLKDGKVCQSYTNFKISHFTLLYYLNIFKNKFSRSAEFLK